VNTNVAHSLLECSNVGYCDRLTGTCKCPPPYSGSACQRMACPKDCSGQGTCATMRQAADFYGYRSTPTTSTLPLPYSNWEADAVTMCICDWGFTGPDCSMKLCSKGDDPLTIGQSYRTITITTSTNNAAAPAGGVFTLYFDGESVQFDFDATAADLEAAINSLDNVELSSVTASAAAGVYPNTYTVQFKRWPTFPRQNNVFSHDGNPPLSSFVCSALKVNTAPVVSPAPAQTVQCALADVLPAPPSTDVREYKACSGRGACNFATGQCMCFPGYGEANCNTLDSMVVTNQDVDVLLLEALNPQFTGTVLHMETTRVGSDSFDLLLAESDDKPTLRIGGSGDISMYQGGLTVYGESLITGKALQLEKGDVYMKDGNILVDKVRTLLVCVCVWCSGLSALAAAKRCSACMCATCAELGCCCYCYCWCSAQQQALPL
jgi:EGF-like domain